MTMVASAALNKTRLAEMKLSTAVSFQAAASNVDNSTTTGVVVQMKRPKFKLEPIRVLEPSQKKLNLPESQRIVSIVEELVKKLEMIDYITFIANESDSLAELIQMNLSDEERRQNYEAIFVSMCEHHKELCASYNTAKFVDSSPPSATANEGADQQQQQQPHQSSSKTKESLESLIKASCRDILRVFQLKPNLYKNVRDEFAKRGLAKSQQLVELTALLNEMREIMNERLLITPHEQKEKIDYLKELLQREKVNNEIIRKLKDEQVQALADKEAEIQTRNDQIRKLDNDLKNVERFSTELIKRTKMDAEQQEAGETKASEGRKAKLQNELNQLRQQFQSLVLEHRDQEQILRKEKLKNEATVENLLGRYDEDMTRKQSEFDEIEALHKEEKIQLEELEEKFKPLEEEYVKIVEERRMQENMRRIEQETLNKKIMAAIVIQSFWRGFKLRKGLFKKGKGKKGGAKKK